jgi:hypothetical protein
MNVPKFIRASSEIEKAFESDTLYKKKWEDGELRTMSGFARIRAEWNHLFNSSPNEVKAKFIGVFADCISDLFPGEIARFVPLYPTSSSSEDEDSFEGSLKHNVFRYDPPVIAGAYKALVHLDEYKTEDNLYLEGSALSIKENLDQYVQKCRDEVSKLTKNPDAQKGKDAENALVHRSEIEVLYHLDSKDKDESTKLRSWRKIYRKKLPNQAFKAHNVYASFFNSKSALEVAQDHNAIPSFSHLANSQNANARAAAVSLLNAVKHGYDSRRIALGEKSPTRFWNITKLWNTIKWKLSSEQSQTNPNEKRVREVFNGDQLEKYEKLEPQIKKVVDSLVNERGTYMGDAFVETYQNLVLKSKSSVSSTWPQGQKTTTDKFVNRVFSELKVNGQTCISDSKAHGDLTFIPFVYEGAMSFYPKHIVVVTLDRANGQIQYYDSQALPPDHPDRRGYAGFDMLNALNQIREKWEAEEPDREIQIVGNPIIHQEDIHSCGVYVCDYMKRRRDGETFESVCMKGKNNEQIIETRDQLAKDIVDGMEISKDNNIESDSGYTTIGGNSAGVSNSEESSDDF